MRNSLAHLTDEQKRERRAAQNKERTRRYRERHPERVRELALERRKRWVENNPIGWRNAQYKYYYGITADDYSRMLAAQNGGCAICGSTPEDGKLLHVDHDHDTGAVRGLLCRGCNTGLGAFKDNKGALFNAIEYLKKHAGAAT